MAKSSSSKQWLREHRTDAYVRQSKLDGYRSRAAYKLLEIHDKTPIFKSGQSVVDLGAAPGGWCQVAEPLVGAKGRVFALDRLTMDAIGGVQFIQGDFTEAAVLTRLMDAVDNQSIDVVLSDMAPNMSGVRVTDQAKAMLLAELALDFTEQVMKPGGSFVCKLFQGEGFQAYINNVKQRFGAVRLCKPKSSRDRSREVYLVARNYKPLLEPN